MKIKNNYRSITPVKWIVVLVVVALSGSLALAAEDIIYTCGMHPEIVSHEPGLCPICNMKLTPKKAGSMNTGTVTIDPVTRQNIGLVTVEAVLETVEKQLYASGRLIIPQDNNYSVNTRVSGWVERLYVSDVGQGVKKGQPLFDIYSPDLVNAQREYLAIAPAINDSSMDQSLVSFTNLATERLRNWGISQDQIEALQKKGEIKRTLTINASADGFVTALNIKTGDEVRPHARLLEISDLSTLWASAYVYETDLPFLELNQTARLSFPALPGEIYSARVFYIAPVLNKSNQIEVRLELDNSKMTLKPDMYAEIILEQQLSGQRLVIPRRAIINSGRRQVVFLASGDDSFEPREITTGAIANDDKIEVISGLTAGDRVVTSGQFLLDSEARLSESLGDNLSHQHGNNHAYGDHAENARGANTDPYDIHTCPMPEHYHVLNYGPGQCPECGMNLVPVGQTDNNQIFVCPMPECGTVAQEPGQCPVCNMALIKYQPGGKDDR